MNKSFVDTNLFIRSDLYSFDRKHISRIRTITRKEP
jgi:hypothetical protein